MLTWSTEVQLNFHQSICLVQAIELSRLDLSNGQQGLSGDVRVPPRHLPRLFHDVSLLWNPLSSSLTEEWQSEWLTSPVFMHHRLVLGGKGKNFCLILFRHSMLTAKQLWGQSNQHHLLTDLELWSFKSCSLIAASCTHWHTESFGKQFL